MHVGLELCASIYMYGKLRVLLEKILWDTYGACVCME
jgi:hypothetical protein